MYYKEKKKYYFKIDTENSEGVEVFVGQNAGNQLNKDILDAKAEVLIISPYIDEVKVDDLLMLKNRNINVRLAFSDLRPEQYGSVLRKLIHQNRVTDVKKKEKRESLKNLFFLSSIILFCLGIFALIYFGIHLVDDLTNSNNLVALLIAIPSLYGFFRCWEKKTEIEKMEIYTYHYSENLNFKYIRNNRYDNKFLHSKIYIIDRKVAYLGSLNYTKSGFTSNFESRIRITQREKVNELVHFVHDIFEDNVNLKKHELFYLGRQIYNEEMY
ncbi:phospholipase D family protein [Chryseobacterium capnotolerans]|uniref:phospholipase D-like domain-containing protein n=1 Tax=Chryseobacterium capnotolerans TaxID=2759528 RepID=UPI001E3D1FAA|nr:phospholipase D-like domain-containing protein [Chryseobacterium capnotolerans]UHO39519.1 phospholipase D family protein [Chryseobacterium capnotolerans]